MGWDHEKQDFLKICHLSICWVKFVEAKLFFCIETNGATPGDPQQIPWDVVFLCAKKTSISCSTPLKILLKQRYPIEVAYKLLSG